MRKDWLLAPMAAFFLLTGGRAGATIIAQHSGSTDPSTEGFVVPSIWNAGTEGAVTNDLGLGINAWNVKGSWCCTGREFTLTSADQASLASNNWLLTVDMRDLSTSTATNGFGPNSLGSGLDVGFGGLRFGFDLHTDGHGDQILAPDAFASGPTYTIAGAGTSYLEIQDAYDAASGTQTFYVNGIEVLSGVKGYGNFYEPWMSFGGEDANFSSIVLETSSSPEPATWGLLAIGVLSTALLRTRLKTNAAR